MLRLFELIFWVFFLATCAWLFAWFYGGYPMFKEFVDSVIFNFTRVFEEKIGV